jgi:hypothetical protein
LDAALDFVGTFRVGHIQRDVFGGGVLVDYLVLSILLVVVLDHTLECAFVKEEIVGRETRFVGVDHQYTTFGGFQVFDGHSIRQSEHLEEVVEGIGF